ncbi:hypothetical protein EfmAA242_02670 [Enterococcus faecium]|nr:hypothetical protein EfmAA242_02670 [Enterococcus faecium]
MVSTSCFMCCRKLTELQGTSGFEQDVRAYMESHMEPLVDELQLDGLGGIFGLRHHEEATRSAVVCN